MKFGLGFIQYESTARFRQSQKFMLFLFAVCLLTLVNPNVAYYPFFLNLRLIVMLLLFMQFYQIVFVRRKEKRAKLFIILSSPFIMSVLLNTLYSNLNSIGFQFKYSLEVTKVSLVLESLLLIGSLILRRNIADK